MAKRKTSRVTTTIVLIAVATIIIIVLSYYFISFFNKPPTNISHNRALDKFGIKEIYPTTIGGRE